jgi:hypothetical protein
MSNKVRDINEIYILCPVEPLLCYGEHVLNNEPVIKIMTFMANKNKQIKLLSVLYLVAFITGTNTLLI